MGYAASCNMDAVNFGVNHRSRIMAKAFAGRGMLEEYRGTSKCYTGVDGHASSLVCGAPVSGAGYTCCRGSRFGEKILELVFT